MSKVIGVKFRDGGKVYYFDPLELDIHTGDGVIVDTARGIVFGDVVEAPHYVSGEQLISELKPVVRIATPEDQAERRMNKEKEKEAFAVCQRKIDEHGLVMKLVDVEYAWGGSKIMFYFTADGRVDFRELVKDLAGVFKTRIELRQIGVRDEAKMLGGLGVCGRPICCSAFLSDFIPVSIKMAKEQNLSLNQTKISGICGRLMCCLKFEQSCYESMHKIMPRVGKEVLTPDGAGVVVDNNVISETTVVKVQLDDDTIEMRTYPFRELMNKAGKPFGEEFEAGCKEDCRACTGQPMLDPFEISEEVYDSSAPEKAENAPSDADDTGDGAGGDTL
ncbi:MAG: stage 0 sporulation family protein [Clostridia bacterium]|nr:stage 0 sporulation family protein [Clostridia bacterium]